MKEQRKFTLHDLRMASRSLAKDTEVKVYHDYKDWDIEDAWFDKAKGVFAIQFKPEEEGGEDE